MFRQMQPVSDLQRLQHFDDTDLAANRAGKLSARQRVQFILARLGEHLLGAIIVLFAVALVSNVLRLAPNLELIGVMFAAVFLVTILLLAVRAYRALKTGVKAASGRLA